MDEGAAAAGGAHTRAGTDARSGLESDRIYDAGHRNERLTPEKLNRADGISDIEGKATRVGASERGQRMSFNPLAITAAAVVSVTSQDAPS